MKNMFKLTLVTLLLLFPTFVWAAERVVTVGGRQPTRPITDFMINIGDEYYVDSVNGDDGRRGLSEATAVATLDYAVGLTTENQGDVIYVLAGHSETITTSIAFDVAGITIKGIGHGTKAPAFTCNAAIDACNVTAANVVIENLYFPASTLTSVTSRINVAAANCGIYDCLFVIGEFDLETITITASGDDLTIEGCQFISDSAGEGDAAIEVEAAGVDGLHVINCYFNGYDDTQAWDTGALNSGAAHTNCLVQGNVSLYGAGIIFSDAATGSIVGNYCAEGTIGSMLDPGSCMCFENYEADAIDETASLFPQTSPVGGGIETDVAAILDDTGTSGVVLGADSITAAKVGDNAFSEEHFDGDSLQAVTAGKKVSKATRTLATGTISLFTVANGRVVIHAIIGEVTVLVQTQATSSKLVSTPTTGTAADLCAALDLTADEAGCLYGITGLTGDAMVGTNAGATIYPKHPVVIPPGVIGLNNAGANNTGSVKWDLYYTPLDTTAIVTAIP